MLSWSVHHSTFDIRRVYQHQRKWPLQHHQSDERNFRSPVSWNVSCLTSENSTVHCKGNPKLLEHQKTYVPRQQFAGWLLGQTTDWGCLHSNQRRTASRRVDWENSRVKGPSKVEVFCWQNNTEEMREVEATNLCCHLARSSGLRKVILFATFHHDSRVLIRRRVFISFSRKCQISPSFVL